MYINYPDLNKYNIKSGLYSQYLQFITYIILFYKQTVNSLNSYKEAIKKR